MFLALHLIISVYFSDSILINVHSFPLNFLVSVDIGLDGRDLSMKQFTPHKCGQMVCDFLKIGPRKQLQILRIKIRSIENFRQLQIREIQLFSSV